MGFRNIHIYGKLKYGAQEQFPQWNYLEFPELHEQFLQTDCADWENSWCSGREDKSTENTERMGAIPQNYSCFRGWQRHTRMMKSSLFPPSSELLQISDA